jgi:hypothetical protein
LHAEINRIYSEGLEKFEIDQVLIQKKFDIAHQNIGIRTEIILEHSHQRHS